MNIDRWFEYAFRLNIDRISAKLVAQSSHCESEFGCPRSIPLPDVWYCLWLASSVDVLLLCTNSNNGTPAVKSRYGGVKYFGFSSRLPWGFNRIFLSLKSWKRNQNTWNYAAEWFYQPSNSARNKRSFRKSIPCLAMETALKPEATGLTFTEFCYTALNTIDFRT